MRFDKVIMSDLLLLRYKISKLSIANRNVRFICYFVLLFTFTLFILYCSSDNSDSVTDWLSGISDILMSICAIIGLIFARRWFGQVVNDEGTKLALKLLEEAIPKIHLGFFSFADVFSFKLIDKEDANNNWPSLSQNIDEFKKEIELLKENRNVVENNYNSLRRRGVDFTIDKLIEYKIMIYKLNAILQDADTICDCVRALKIRAVGPTSMVEALAFNQYSSEGYDKDMLFEILGSSIERLFPAIQDYRKQCEVFFAGNPHIKNYFRSS